jgi:hypothetical protein
MKMRIEDRLVVALKLALKEIQNPGAARVAGYDIVELCEWAVEHAASGAAVGTKTRKVLYDLSAVCEWSLKNAAKGTRLLDRAALWKTLDGVFA